MKNNERGITLIALIITVIVLLILAGVAIGIAINGGDVFGKSADAREKWNIAVEQENTIVRSVMDLLNMTTTGNNESTPTPTPEPTPEEDIPEDAVARIEDEFFPSLQDAFFYVGQGEEPTIILLKNTSENIYVPDYLDVNLNLNGKTISNDDDDTIIDLGESNLTIYNGSIIGGANGNFTALVIEGDFNSELTLHNVIVESYAPYSSVIETYGSFNIDSGKVQARGDGNALCVGYSYDGAEDDEYFNPGITNISGTAEILSNDGYALCNEFTTVNFTGGKIQSSSYVSLVVSGGILNMSGTAEISETEYRTNIYSGGTITINGGTIKGVIENGSDLTINNITSFYGNIENYGDLKLKGGRFETGRYSVLDNKVGGNVEISGTTEIIAPNGNTAIGNNGGTMIMTGGKVTGNNLWAIDNSGSLQISGNSIIEGNSNQYPTIRNSGIYHNGNEYNGSLSVTGGKITSSVGSALLVLSGTAVIDGTATLEGVSNTVVNKATTTIRSGVTIKTTSNSAVVNDDSVSGSVTYLSHGCTLIGGGTSGTIQYTD